MSTDDPRIINFAKLSWKELKPEDDYDVKLEITPEIIHKHEEFVKDYLENDFNVERVIRIRSKWKEGFGDLTESGQEWHKRLAECLKRLCRQYDKKQVRR